MTTWSNPIVRALNDAHSGLSLCYYREHLATPSTIADDAVRVVAAAWLEGRAK